MTRALAALVALAAALAVAAPAFAKAPTPDEMPTLEQIYQRAKKQKEEADASAREAARDPLKEAIEAYRAGDKALDDFHELTEVINNAKDARLQPYRQAASAALTERFIKEEIDDPFVRRTRAAVALEILDLMKTSSSDTVGLAIIQDILESWWRSKMRNDIKFGATSKWRERQRAWRKMKSYLQGGERE